MSIARWSIPTLAPLLAVAACSGDDGAQPDGFVVDGTAVSRGSTVPGDGHLAAIWPVSSGSPDYVYKFGDGASHGAALELALTADPPVEARNGTPAAGFGVGIVALYPTSWSAPDGVITEAAITTSVLGASSNHAIIWKQPGVSAALEELVPWLSAFPDGYSCAVCVRAASGFDSWAPTACENLQVDVAPDLDALDFCNWT